MVTHSPNSGDGLSPARLLALSCPTFVFAGYDLARRSFLAAYLTGTLGLSIPAAGLLVTIAGFASIPVEALVGALSDRGLRRFGPRASWMLAGTFVVVVASIGLLLATPAIPRWQLTAILSALVVGWAMCNVTHGAWALETATGSSARTRIFGLRSLFGIAGGIVIAAMAAIIGRHGGSPFIAIIAAVAVLAPIAHGLLVAVIPDRRDQPSRWTAASLIEPLRILFESKRNRQLAGLFAIDGAHAAVTTTSYLYLVGNALGLPEWGAFGVFVQSVCAGVGIVIATRIGARWPPVAILRVALFANLLLALASLLLRPNEPGLLVAWTAIFGLFSAVDFLALRVMLGDLLDADPDHRAGTSRAAAHYAGFHLPFNLCGAAMTGLLFAGYGAMGFDPRAAASAEHLYLSVLAMPAIVAAALMILSLRLLATFRSEAGSNVLCPPSLNNILSDRRY